MDDVKNISIREVVQSDMDGNPPICGAVRN